MAPLAVRKEAWLRLAQDLDVASLDLIGADVPLEGAIAKATGLLDGGVRGRVVVCVR